MTARLAVLLLILAAGAARQPPRVPVLLELFTSEGCSTCPVADALIADLQREQPIEGVEVIPVGLHVDYFDHLGWKDAFASPAFTRRQRDYSEIFGGDSIYTPEIVVDGQEAVEGNDRTRVERAIASSVERPHLKVHVAARAAGDGVHLTIALPAAPDTGEPVHVVGAITEDGLSSVVKRGENGGRTLHHVAVARSLRRLEVLIGAAATLSATVPIKRSWSLAALRAIVWLEGERSRKVYGAATTRVLP